MLSEEAIASLVGGAASVFSSSGDSTACVGGSSSMESDRKFPVASGSPLAVGSNGLVFDLGVLGSAGFFVLTLAINRCWLNFRRLLRQAIQITSRPRHPTLAWMVK